MNPVSICPKFRKSPREAVTENKHGEKTYFLEYLCDLNSDINNSKAGDDIEQIQWIEKIN